MAEPLDLNYSPELFIQMMAFLRERMENFTPYIYKYGGFVYLFKTASQKAQFISLIETNETEAMNLVFDSWREAPEKTMNISVLSGYQNVALLGAKGNVISFTFSTVEVGGAESSEPVTVNYTFSCNGIVQTQQEQYAAGTEVNYNIDDFLLEGTNEITIQVRGNQSKVASSVTIIYKVSEISVDSNFNISKTYGDGDSMGFDVIAKGTSDTGDLFVEYYIDGSKKGELKVSGSDIGTQKRLTIAESDIPTASGKHTLQLRVRATIGTVNKYSNVMYYEWIRLETSGKFVTIKRLLNDSNVLGSASSLTINCEQYVTETITYGFHSSDYGEQSDIRWALEPKAGGESTSVGSSEIGGDVAGNDEVEYQMAFMPLESGQYYLVAYINGTRNISYDVTVSINSSGLEEANVSEMKCRLFALGRSNSEPEDERKVWKYKGVTTTFENVQWNSVSGWVNNALQLAEGAKATIDVQPFISMQSNTSGCTVEVELETYGVENENAVVVSVGQNLYIKSNSATIIAPNSKSQLTDKFPTNRRIKFGFVVHAKSSASQPMLMEIINGGITSRCTGYQSTDNFVDTGKIILGGTSNCGVRIYSIRVYDVSLTNKEELNNVIVSSDDIATMVRNNDIYNGTSIDVEKIRNRIPCLWITGHGGTDVLESIWNSQSKVQIHVDAEWTNPLDGGQSNWRCTDMRLRSHGQSTLRNPLKSLKMWFKNESDQNIHNTQFYRGTEEEPMSEPRWSMKSGSMPQNKFVAQCYYIDSSNCKSPSLMDMIDTAMRSCGIYTPPMRYAVEEYPAAMRDAHGEDPSGKNWKFPYDIRYTPDSIPCVIISRSSSTDASGWHFDGIFVLMDDKKSDYLYGERSIYDCPDDPFCFFHDKSDYNTLWDNADTTRFEFLSNTHPLVTFKSISSFFLAPQSFTPDDDEQDVETTPGGGEDSGSTDSDATYDFEQAEELIYPDIDDLRGKKKWPTNYANPSNLSDLTPHANRLYQFHKWVYDCYAADDDYEKFQEEASAHMDLDHWACYYIFAMMNGCFDSLVRNMQLTTFEKENGIYRWLPLWWDIDIQDGTINTGQLAFDAPVNRQTESSDYGVAFRGEESWLWDALEAWPEFLTRCRSILNRLNNAGYTFNALVTKQDNICNTWPEAMYNESQNYKYKQMYLKNTASNARYLYYLLGDGKTFRRYWLKKNFDYWFARLAAGDFAKNGVAVRWNGGSATVKVTYGDSTFFGWSQGDSLVRLPNGGYSQEVTRGQEVSFTPTDTSNSMYSTVYSAQYIMKADYSQNAENMLNVNLTNFKDSVTGTLLEELNLGLTETSLRAGKRNGAEGIFEGWGSLTSLKKLWIQGFSGLGITDLSSSVFLTHLYARGSSFNGIKLADSITLSVAELPTTMTYMDFTNVKFQSLKFYKPSDPYGTSYDYPLSMTNAKLMDMGDDEVIHSMVKAWVSANESNLNNLSLSITGLNWMSCTYEEIALIGLIPRDKRDLRGRVRIVSVNGEQRSLTTDEMNTLIERFNDTSKNINVFSSSSTFQIDCREGFVITGPTELWAGESGKVSCAVFPLAEGDWNYSYRLTQRDGEDVPSNVQPNSSNKQIFGNFTLNCGDGRIETVEDTSVTHTYRILCTATSLTSTKTGTIDLQVKKRTYPTTLNISGNTLIETNGEYVYNIVRDSAYTNATGNQRGNYADENKWAWSFEDTADIKLKNKTGDSATMSITNYTEDTYITIGYNANYKGLLDTIEAPSIRVVLIYNSGMSVVTQTSDSALYAALDEWLRANSKRDAQAFSDRVIIKKEALIFTSLPDGCRNNNEIHKFTQIGYFRNLTSIDMSGSDMSDGINIGENSEVVSVNMSGVNCNISGVNGLAKLNSIHYGSPTKIEIKNCSSLNIN